MVADDFRRLSALVEKISGKPVPEHAKSLIFEVIADDAADEEAEIPYVMVKLQK